MEELREARVTENSGLMQEWKGRRGMLCRVLRGGMLKQGATIEVHSGSGECCVFARHEEENAGMKASATGRHVRKVC
jgi:MOSC domain-containing protein YiiM